MIVYLDGENVVHQLVDVAKRLKLIDDREGLIGLNIMDLLRQLLKKDDFSAKYYTTTLRLVRTDPILEQRSRNMMAWSENWANNLVTQGIQIVKAGKLKIRDSEVCPRCGYQETIFREKGVDVRLAVDILVDSEQDQQQVVWSSDADLIPAIQVAKRRGSRVKNITHQETINWAVAKQCGEWQMYKDTQIKQLFNRLHNGN